MNVALSINRNQLVSSTVLEKEYVSQTNRYYAYLTVGRKNREITEVFSSGLSGAAFLDAIADVYNGVRTRVFMIIKVSNPQISLYSGPC
jgi:hypothetical protein